MIDIAGILARIPHRYPFLLIDRVCDVAKGERCVALKNVTINEHWFAGHFPGHPVMPGVLLVEALAQTAAVLVVDSLDGVSAATHVVYFMSIEDARFRKPVVPGDQIVLTVTKQRQRGSVWRFYGEAKVDNAVCAEATFTAMMVPRETLSSPTPDKMTSCE